MGSSASDVASVVNPGGVVKGWVKSALPTDAITDQISRSFRIKLIAAWEDVTGPRDVTYSCISRELFLIALDQSVQFEFSDPAHRKRP
jgi:hypothetical protein